jgi:hypothetical protein
VLFLPPSLNIRHIEKITDIKKVGYIILFFKKENDLMFLVKYLLHIVKKMHFNQGYVGTEIINVLANLKGIL